MINLNRFNELSQQSRRAMQRLESFFSQQKALMIAYSGGMDSSFLALAASKYLPQAYRAVLVNSPFMPENEVRLARNTAEVHQLVFEEIELDPLQSPVIVCNDLQRCYHCKNLVFQGLKNIARDGETICEGSVSDDDSDFRPGKAAIRELQIASPLQTCGFSKAMLAEVLTAMGAPEVIRAGQSCLATRIATGDPLTLAKLKQIDRGEELLRRAGLSFCRLRHHGHLARIETGFGEQHLAVDIATMLADDFKKLGFRHVCVDIAGYTRGSMNIFSEAQAEPRESEPATAE